MPRYRRHRGRRRRVRRRRIISPRHTRAIANIAQKAVSRVSETKKLSQYTVGNYIGSGYATALYTNTLNGISRGTGASQFEGASIFLRGMKATFEFDTSLLQHGAILRIMLLSSPHFSNYTSYSGWGVASAPIDYYQEVDSLIPHREFRSDNGMKIHYKKDLPVSITYNNVTRYVPRIWKVYVPFRNVKYEPESPLRRFYIWIVEAFMPLASTAQYFKMSAKTEVYFKDA